MLCFRTEAKRAETQKNYLVAFYFIAVHLATTNIFVFVFF